MPANRGHWPEQDAVAPAIERVGDWLASPRGRRAAPAEAPHTDALIAEGAPVLPAPPPHVTIIVLSRDGAALLERLFASIKRVNTYPNIDIVLVDHAGTDDSLDVAEKWAASLPLTVVRCAENYSYAYSCNRAAERAGGDYLMLLNNDVVLTEDAIGRMVAAAARHRGMVGCRLVGPDGAVQHIGVRFRWGERLGFALPYNAVPVPGDERIAQAPSRFVAVTFAAAICRREDYLAAGGLCEDYVYGHEDVDLCLKLALRHGRTHVALNDVAVRHDERATRKMAGPAEQRRRLDNNAEVLSRRFGYALRRTVLASIFSGDGSQWGRRARVGFVPGPDAARMAEIAGRLDGWNVERVGHDLGGLDLLIVADPAFRPERTRHRPPMMLRVAWLLDGRQAWARHDLSAYDLVIDRDDAAATFRETLLDYLTAKHRFAIKAGDERFALALAAELRRAGHFVRIDRPAEWRCRDTMRDDVAIILPGDPACVPAPDKIAIAQNPGVDPAAAAAAILASVEQLHAERMKGPQDRPLTPRPPFARRVSAGWD